MNTRKKKVSDLARWLAIPLAATVVDIGVRLFSFFVFLVASPFPNLYPYLSSFIFSLALVAVVAWLVPKYKRHITVAAIILATLYNYKANFMIGQTTSGPEIFYIIAISLLGGIIPLLLTFYFTSHFKKIRTTKIVVAASVSLLVILAGLFCLSFIDFWAKPDQLPQNSVLENYPITNYYEYRLGGFLDTTNLLRFDVDEKTIRNIAATTKLTETIYVPENFFSFRPHWWLNALPKNYLAFKSSEFSFRNRPGDGTYYFVVYDQDNMRAYMWEDANF